MQIFSGSEIAQVGDFVLSPYARYVLPDNAANALRQLFTAHNFKYSISHFNSFERRHIGDATGKRIAMMRSDAFGDTLMATAIPAYLKWKYPECRVDVYATKLVGNLWLDCGARVYEMPLLFESATAYDAHILLEHLYEENSIQDKQINAYDSTYNFLGIDYESVPDEFKRPHIAERETDWEELKLLRIDPSKGRSVVIQYATGNKTRQYPSELIGSLIGKILKIFPSDVIVYVVGHGADTLNTHAPGLIGNPRVVNLINRTKNFRSLIPLVSRAKVVICPDSSILHMAAGFPTGPKIISIWGLFHPDDRAKYYSNNFSIFQKDVCQFAPCRFHEFHLPIEQCTTATNNIVGKKPEYCNVIRAATPDIIIEKMREIITL